MKLFKMIRVVIEVLNWLRIFLSPTLIGLLIAVSIYLNFNTFLGHVLALSILVLGMLLGVIWATRAWKKKGTTIFMSAVNASPDLDHLVRENELIIQLNKKTLNRENER